MTSSQHHQRVRLPLCDHMRSFHTQDLRLYATLVPLDIPHPWLHVCHDIPRPGVFLNRHLFALTVSLHPACPAEPELAKEREKDNKDRAVETEGDDAQEQEGAGGKRKRKRTRSKPDKDAAGTGPAPAATTSTGPGLVEEIGEGGTSGRKRKRSRPKKGA